MAQFDIGTVVFAIYSYIYSRSQLSGIHSGIDDLSTGQRSLCADTLSGWLGDPHRSRAIGSKVPSGPVLLSPPVQDFLLPALLQRALAVLLLPLWLFFLTLVVLVVLFTWSCRARIVCVFLSIGLFRLWG